MVCYVVTHTVNKLSTQMCAYAKRFLLRLIENICKNQLNMKNELKFSISLICLRLHVQFFLLFIPNTIRFVRFFFILLFVAVIRFAIKKGERKERKKNTASKWIWKYEKFQWNGINLFHARTRALQKFNRFAMESRANAIKRSVPWVYTIQSVWSSNWIMSSDNILNAVLWMVAAAIPSSISAFKWIALAIDNGHI